MKDGLKDDLVSRKAASDAMYNLCSTDRDNPYCENPHIDAIQDAILDLPPVKTVDADKLIKKLDSRIDEFIKKHPDKKYCEPVVMIQELIHLIRLEAEE